LNKLLAICQQTTWKAGAILHLLLQLPFSLAQFKVLERYFGTLAIPASGFPVAWRASDSSKLTGLNDCTAFQVGLSRGENLKWMVRWIGESELRQLLNRTEAISLPDLIAAQLAVEKSADLAGQLTRWARHDNDWGIGDDNNHRYRAALHALETALAENPGPAKLFNELFVKNIQPRLAPLQKQYPLLSTKLAKRIEILGDPLLSLTAERVGLTALAAALYRRGQWPSPDYALMRQIARLQSYCPEFYRHDLVLIEFYLLGGGK